MHGLRLALVVLLPFGLPDMTEIRSNITCSSHFFMFMSNKKTLIKWVHLSVQNLDKGANQIFKPKSGQLRILYRAKVDSYKWLNLSCVNETIWHHIIVLSFHSNYAIVKIQSLRKKAIECFPTNQPNWQEMKKSPVRSISFLLQLPSFPQV